MIRKIRLLKNRLKVAGYKAAIFILEWLSSKNILVKKHDVSYSNVYPVSEPRVYRTAYIFRCAVQFQYVTHRLISVCEKWYYPIWKEDKINNAIMVVCNSITESIEVKMKAVLKSFLFHPENFEKSIEIIGSSPYRFVSKNMNDFVRIYPSKIEDAKIEVKTHIVDLSKFTLVYSGKYESGKFTRQNEDLLLKRLSEDMIMHIEGSVEEINRIVSGVTETYDLGMFELIPDILCGKCGSPVMQRKDNGDKYCVHDCSGEMHSIYYDNSGFLFKRVNHVEWMKSCEYARDEIREVYDKYR